MTHSGALFASWYDGREVNGGADLNCPVGSPNACYRRWGRVSLDNGATWQPDAMVGSALTGLPAQPDGTVQATYEGDYDYHSTFGLTAIGGWTDGRNVISGNAQQDVFVSFVVGATPTASPTPTPSATASPTPSATFTPTPTIVPCSNYFTTTTTGNTIVPGVTDTGSHCDDCATAITFPFPVYFYGTSYTTANVSSNGNLDMTGKQSPFTHGCLVLPNGPVLNTTQIYDIASNTWTTGAIMPDTSGRYFPAAVYDSVNGKIYVIGGFDGSPFSEQSQTWDYDPVANTWNTSRAPIPVAMGGASYSIVGEFVYLAGHWNGGLGSKDHYR